MQLRVDGNVGQLAGQAVRSASVALEVGPGEFRRSRVRAFGLLGGSAIRFGRSSDGGLMAGGGARVRVRRAALFVEQRYQPGFSPLLAGFSF